MKRGAPLKRTKGLAPGKPLAPISADRLKAFGGRFPRNSLERPGAPKMRAQTRHADTGPKRSERQVVHARSGGGCEFSDCAHVAEHLHHRRPRRMGGSSAPDVNGAANLVHLCSWHHRWVELNRAEALAMGLLLPAKGDPLRVPVLTRHDEEPIWLLASGEWLRYEEACA